ncbi:MAG: hypothetical protein ACRCXY_11435 [Fusobacteriaceae bacterium]
MTKQKPKQTKYKLRVNTSITNEAYYKGTALRANPRQFATVLKNRAKDVKNLSKGKNKPMDLDVLAKSVKKQQKQLNKDMLLLKDKTISRTKRRNAIKRINVLVQDVQNSLFLKAPRKALAYDYTGEVEYVINRVTQKQVRDLGRTSKEI